MIEQSGGVHKHAMQIANFLFNKHLPPAPLLFFCMYAHRVPSSTRANCYVTPCRYSAVNVDAVNISEYPEFAAVPLDVGVARPGDCVFVPWGYVFYF